MSCKEYIDFEIRKGPRKGSHVKIKCGRCVLCRIDRRREWTQRLHWEWMSNNYKGHFLTLTYNDNFLGDNNLDYKDIQNFMKRVRKRVTARDKNIRLKFYAAGEYGEQTLRKHWHLIIFGDVSRIELLRCWYFGGCDIKPIHRNRLRYVLKYLDKEMFFDPRVFAQFSNKTPPCHHMSNGIGSSWLSDNLEIIQDGYIQFGKKIVPVPRYYREKYGLPAPLPVIDPEKKRQLDEFRASGVSYIVAYGLVYGSYARSIAQRAGVADCFKNYENARFRKNRLLYDTAVKCIKEILT